MLCPFCLKDTSPPTCAKCKEPLDALYINEYRRASHTAIMSAVGFSGHGKTVYLAALLDAMEKELNNKWPGFCRMGLDWDTITGVKENLARLRAGDLPESTRRNFPRPSVHLLTDMPRYRNRRLIMYDPPGEAFDMKGGIEKYAHFVKDAPTVLFLISLPDIPAPQASELHRLLNQYVAGMAAMQAKTKNQHLVVVFTKADRLKGELAACPLTLAHLNGANRSLLPDTKKYFAALRNVSGELARFTETALAAQPFVRLARNSFRDVEYCAVSALGSPPEDGHLTTAMEPRCVADPLIWVLEKS